MNVYLWNGSAWTPLLPCADCTQDTVGNKLTVKLNHLIFGNYTPALLTIENATVEEGNSTTGSASFNVRIAASSNQTITIAYATADDTAIADADYVATSGTLLFPPGVVNLRSAWRPV